MDKSSYFLLSRLSFIGGLVSVIISLSAWYITGGTSDDIEIRASAERLGIFIGIWAPTMLALSTCLRQMGGDGDDG